VTSGCVPAFGAARLAMVRVRLGFKLGGTTQGNHEDQDAEKGEQAPSPMWTSRNDIHDHDSEPPVRWSGSGQHVGHTLVHST